MKATINHFQEKYQDLSRIKYINRRKKKKENWTKIEEVRAILVAGMGKKMQAKKRQARKN